MNASYAARGLGRFLETIAGRYAQERDEQRASGRAMGLAREQANLRMGEMSLRQYLEENSPEFQGRLRQQEANIALTEAQTDAMRRSATAGPPREGEPGYGTYLRGMARAAEGAAKEEALRSRKALTPEQQNAELLLKYTEYSNAYFDTDPDFVVTQGALSGLGKTDYYSTLEKRANTLRKGKKDESGGPQMDATGSLVLGAQQEQQRPKIPTFAEWMRMRDAESEPAPKRPIRFPGADEPKSVYTDVDPLGAAPQETYAGPMRDEQPSPPGSEAALALGESPRVYRPSPDPRTQKTGWDRMREAAESFGARPGAADYLSLEGGGNYPQTPPPGPIGNVYADGGGRRLGPKAEAAVARAERKGISREAAIQQIVDAYGEEALSR